MRILEQRPGFLVCYQTAMTGRVGGLLFFGLGVGAIVLAATVHQNVHGSPIVAYIAGTVFVLAGAFIFSQAEDDRIVLDSAAHVARIIRKGLWRQSTTEVPFASITDVALEVSVWSRQGSANQQFTWRPVFVCQHDRVPWTPMWTSDRTSQARAVAAARAVGGWNALPIDASPALGRALATVQNLGCLYAFAAIFGLICLGMLYAELVPLLTWKPTPATVQSSNTGYVRTSKGTTWKPVIQYSYSVAGVDYSSYKVAPIEQSASQRWAQDIVDRYPPGASVTAYYNPRKPSDAYIDRHFSYIPLIFMGFLAGIGLWIVVLAKRAQAMNAAALAGGDVPVVSRR